MTISTASNTVTEQLTEAGRAIEHDSFAIIDGCQGGSHTTRISGWQSTGRMRSSSA